LAVAAVGVTYAQIVLGAWLTHEGWLWLHLAGAVAVFAIVPVVTARARRTGDPVAARLSWALLALLGVQAALGIGAYLSRFSPIWIPGEQATMLAVPVAHRLVGGLILCAIVVLAVRLHTVSVADGVRPQRERGGMGGAVGAPHVNAGVRSQRDRGGMGGAERAPHSDGRGMGGAVGAPHLKEVSQ
jgi:heme A synthase